MFFSGKINLIDVKIIYEMGASSQVHTSPRFVIRLKLSAKRGRAKNAGKQQKVISKKVP